MPVLIIENELHNGMMIDDVVTRRGTHVQMMECPTLGLPCIMDGLIQSTELDQKIYHYALVKRAMDQANQIWKDEPLNIMIIGGGEGAVAREVFLRGRKIGRVDMFEWDEEVVTLFRDKYPQWSNGAFEDPRLHLHYDDITERLDGDKILVDENEVTYHIILVDLFDMTSEKELEMMKTCIEKLGTWLHEKGTCVMYVGMENATYTNDLIHNLLEDKTVFPEHSRLPYREFIPSYEGHADFLWFCPRSG